MEIKFRPQDQNPTIQSHHRNNLTLWKPYLDLDKERGKNAQRHLHQPECLE